MARLRGQHAERDEVGVEGVAAVSADDDVEKAHSVWVFSSFLWCICVLVGALEDMFECFDVRSKQLLS